MYREKINITYIYLPHLTLNFLAVILLLLLLFVVLEFLLCLFVCYYSDFIFFLVVKLWNKREFLRNFFWHRKRISVKFGVVLEYFVLSRTLRIIHQWRQSKNWIFRPTASLYWIIYIQDTPWRTHWGFRINPISPV